MWVVKTISLSDLDIENDGKELSCAVTNIIHVFSEVSIDHAVDFVPPLFSHWSNNSHNESSLGRGGFSDKEIGKVLNELIEPAVSIGGVNIILYFGSCDLQFGSIFWEPEESIINNFESLINGRINSSSADWVRSDCSCSIYDTIHNSLHISNNVVEV